MNQDLRETPKTRPRIPAWSPAGLISFGVILAALTIIGLIGRFHRPAIVEGVPVDTRVRAAVTVLGGPLRVESGDLRFETSLGAAAGEAPPVPPGPPGAPDPARLLAAERLLLDAGRRRPLDPRVECLLGHLELAQQRLERAQRRYHAALDRAPGYGEARLGLGVALALQAQTEGDERRARGLQLQAIAQFAAVGERDPFFLPALYDRTQLLVRIGRTAEAQATARRYTALEPGSVWTAALARTLDLAP